MSQGGKDDRDLDAFLARGTAVQGRWREASFEEPPASLDAVLQAAARRAVQAGPRASHRSFAERWRVPLSIAAVVVVSVTVSLMVADEREHLPGTELQLPPVPAPAPSAGQEALAPSEQDAKEEKPAAPPMQKPASAAKLDGARKDDAAASRERMDEAPVAPGAAARAREQAAPAPAPAAVLEDAAPRAAAKDEAEMSSRTEVRGFSQAAPAAPPPVASDAARAQPSAPAVEPSASVEAAEAQSTAAGEAAPAAKRAPVGDALDKSRDAFQAQPERWIERIRALRAAGRLQEAEDSLRDFVRRYPAYPLPPDLSPR